MIKVLVVILESLLRCLGQIISGATQAIHILED